MATIYGLCDPETHEVRYVGKTIGDPRRRLTGHMRVAKRKRTPRDCWISKLGCRPEITILDQGPFVVSQLNALECEWIRYGRALGWRLLNCTDGGDGGYSGPMSEATRAKVSATHKGKPKSAEHRRKISEGNKGVSRRPKTPRPPASAETRAKISAALTGRSLTPEHRATLSIAQKKVPRQGHVVTAETRAKISVANRGRKVSDEARAKISAAQMGHPKRPMSEEGKARVSAANRGLKRSPEHIAAIRAAHLGKTISPELRAKMSAGQQKHREARRESMTAMLHNRWHVARGIVNPDCALCAEVE